MDRQSISVLIAAYNAGAFLDTTLRSVDWQTVRAAEVIVVDDGSTDDTVEVVKCWQDRLPIRLIQNQQNVGIGASRAKGLAYVTAPLVALLDADDVWLPAHLETLLSTYSHDRQIVSPRAAVWIDGKTLSLTGHYSHDAPPTKRQFKSICRSNFVFSGSLFPLKMIEEVGGYPNQRVAEDHVLWLRAISIGFEVVKPEGVTVLYRRHGQGLSRISSGFFIAVAQVIKHEAPAFRGVQFRNIKSLIRRLELQSHLSLHDEGQSGYWKSVATNLLPVLLRAPARLKLSAIVRIVRPRWKSPYQ